MFQKEIPTTSAISSLTRFRPKNTPFVILRFARGLVGTP
jgi:hypothetical protein